MKVSLLGIGLAFPAAVGVSWYLAKSTLPGKTVIDIFISLPLVLPPVTVGYFLLIILGNQSPIGKILADFGLNLVFTWIGAALAAGIVSFPLMVRSMEVAFSNVESNFEKAARSLGANPLQTFFRVTFPLAKRGVLASIVLGYARALGEFGATIVVAGNIPGQTQTLPLAIFTYLQTGDDFSALRLMVVSVVLSLVALVLHRQMNRKVWL